MILDDLEERQTDRESVLKWYNACFNTQEVEVNQAQSGSQVLQPGRIVIVNIEVDTDEPPMHRPAIVTEVHDATTIDAVVFDGIGGSGATAQTSIKKGTGYFEWQWPFEIEPTPV